MLRAKYWKMNEFNKIGDNACVLPAQVCSTNKTLAACMYRVAQKSKPQTFVHVFAKY